MVSKHARSTLVIDNGAYQIKAGWAGGECVQITNALMRSRDRRVWMSNDVEKLRDVTGLQYRRPIERGQLISWELEKAIWDWMFDSKLINPLPEDLKDTTLVLTESPGSLAAVTVSTDQIVLEEYEFGGYRRTSPQALVAAGADVPSECKLVIDIGFSATQIVPIYNNMAVPGATRRIDVGGKVLTNYLKELVSHRYYNMMEESTIMGRLKERACFVAPDFDQALQTWKESKHIYDFGYILPDHLNTDGVILESEDEIKRARAERDRQVLVLGNERFSVPEALFDPRMVGYDEAGIPETVAQSIKTCPEELQPIMWANVIVTGGGSLLPNLKPRIQEQLRSLAPEDCIVNVSLPENPITASWQGGVALSKSPEFQDLCISRADYLEAGESICIRKFGRMK